MHRNLILPFGLALIALGAAPGGFAARPLELVAPADAVNFVALAVGQTPDYPGSDDSVIGAAPLIHWEFAPGRPLALVATKLSVDLLSAPDWKFGPVVNYRLGREQVTDNVVRLLTPIDGTVEVGLFASTSFRLSEDPRHRFNLSADLLADVGEVHRGVIGGVQASYLHPLARRWLGFCGAGVDFASSPFTRTYFGVPPADVSHFPSLNGTPHRPQGGLFGFRLNAGLLFHLTPKWHLLAGAQWQRLTGAVADSPLVRERGNPDQWVWGAGLGWVF